MDEEFASKTIDQWREILKPLSGAWAVLQKTSELYDDPAVIANGYIPTVNAMNGKPYILPTNPVQFDGHHVAADRRTRARSAHRRDPARRRDRLGQDRAVQAGRLGALGAELALRRMPRVRPISRLSSNSRSVSDRPPQMPYGSPTSRACARHCAITGHCRHISLARRSRCIRARPRSPSGWKNTDESTPRQSPCNCHSQMSALGPGSCSGCGIEVPLYTPIEASSRSS